MTSSKLSPTMSTIRSGGRRPCTTRPAAHAPPPRCPTSSAVRDSVLSHPVEQLAPAFLLRIIRVLDLQPSGARVIWIGQALRHNPLEIERTHQFVELASAADDRLRLGNDRRSLWQNALQAAPALAERQREQVGT